MDIQGLHNLRVKHLIYFGFTYHTNKSDTFLLVNSVKYVFNLLAFKIQKIFLGL